MHAIEKELTSATDFKPRKKYANRQEYLRAIINAVGKLEDEDFDNLTDEAAEWCNAAIEVMNTTKDGEIPDFDEAEASEDEPEEEAADDEADEPDDEAEDDGESEDDDEGDEPSEDDGDDEPEEEPKPKLMGKGVKHEKSPNRPNVRSKAAKAKIAATAPKPKTPANMDVVLDKWGCMEGSKNSQALAMFEKGATTAEVKKAIGGTYYNILKKCTEAGHKLEKEGAKITLIHKDDAGKPAAKKAPAKKGKK